MSLEVAINENTAAVKALIAALGAGVATPGYIAPDKAPAGVIGRPATISAEEIAANTKVAAELAATKARNAAPAALDYDKDVKAPFLALAKAKGRDVALGLLTPYGVATANLVPADKWPELVAAIAQAAA